MALAWHGQSCLSLKSEDAEAFWKALLPTDRILSCLPMNSICDTDDHANLDPE